MEIPRIDLGHHVALFHRVTHIYGARDQWSTDPERQVDLLGRLGPAREAAALQFPYVAGLDGPHWPDDLPFGFRFIAAAQCRQDHNR